MKKVINVVIVAAVVVLFFAAGVIKIDINLTSSETKTYSAGPEVVRVEETSYSKSAKESSENEGVSEDVKIFWTSYEAFVDEYLEFTENCDLTDFNTAIKATDYLNTSLNLAVKSAKYDEEKMSDADASYVSAVRERIEAKLVKIAESNKY